MFNKSAYTKLVIAIISLFVWAQSSSAQENHLSARIVTATQNITTDKDLSSNIGVTFDIQPGWHIYWDNSGDSGIKTKIKWEFDKNVHILEENITPTPQRFDTSGIINYGFEDNVLYKSVISYQDNKQAFSLFAKAHISYLICKDICLPEKITIERALTLGDDTSPSVDAAIFNKANQRTPHNNSNLKVDTELAKNQYSMNISGLNKGIKSATFIPSTEGLIDDASKQVWKTTKAGYSLTFKNDVNSRAEFKNIEGILNLDNKDFIKFKSPLTKIKLVEAPVKTKKKIKAKKGKSTSTKIKETKSQEEIQQYTLNDVKHDKKLQYILLFAFLGGLILNLMPCVLPVLSLKALSLIHHAKSYFTWWYGLVYTAGVLATFSLLAFAMIALRDGGITLGWGFQLQEPIFVAGLALIMLLVALQLANVFNFGASFGRLQNLVSGHGTIATFFSGMLITIVATPCTAPFMATAIAFALMQPNDIIYLTFGALGLGLAFPYLLMTFTPGISKLLPKPGAWEITFQQFLSFPMFATVLWLTWVYAKQTSIEKLFALLIAILIVSLTTWIFGRLNVLRSSRIKRWFGLIIFASGIVYFFFAINALDKWYKPKETSIEWEKWSIESVEEGLSQDRPVFVNFTADWCITCKVNEKIVLETDDIKTFIESKGILMLQADWTSKNNDISAELKKFNRYGVPLYLMYSPKDPNNPKILKQILTPSEFKESL